MTNQIDDIFCFYWLDSGGTTKYTWYNRSENENFEQRDMLLSGFLSALMLFSQEMFGDDISSTNIKEKLMNFRKITKL